MSLCYIEFSILILTKNKKTRKTFCRFIKKLYLRTRISKILTKVHRGVAQLV